MLPSPDTEQLCPKLPAPPSTACRQNISILQKQCRQNMELIDVNWVKKFQPTLSTLEKPSAF